MFKKALLIMVAVAFMCVPALAGERPEFDAVGDDSAIYFQDIAKALVLANNPWNFDSDFTALLDAWDDPQEYWDGPGAIRPDLCFPNYQSRKVGAGYTGGLSFSWKIVLQMQPDTDLDINIMDCVVKINSNTVWGDSSYTGAHQMGRYLWLGFLSTFDEFRNPVIRARAIAGPNAAGPWDWFYLTARKHPTLELVTLDGDGTYFTSKGIWDESIVVRLPTPGVPVGNQLESTLMQGDMIEIQFLMPEESPVDIRYGQYSVFIKYVGVYGSDWTATDAL
jgi:hypothetical protein